MDSEQHGTTQEKPATEKAVASGTVQAQQPPRHGQRRPRFKRDNRAGRGDRRDRGPRTENPRPVEAEHRKPSSSISQAIDQVEHIRTELKKALDDLHEALRTLEQVEREKNASEEEIELLRESLRLLQRDQGHVRQPRNFPPRPVSAPDHPPAEAETEADQDPDQAS